MIQRANNVAEVLQATSIKEQAQDAMICADQAIVDG